MELHKENILLFASKAYTNEYCANFDEFVEDFKLNFLIKKLSCKIADNKSVNIRLLCNHIQCFTNNFSLPEAKKILFFEVGDKEKQVLKTVLTYFGFLRENEFPEVKHCLTTAKLLKEMDK